MLTVVASARMAMPASERVHPTQPASSFVSKEGTMESDLKVKIVTKNSSLSAFGPGVVF
jgi:hypothetical protein